MTTDNGGPTSRPDQPVTVRIPAPRLPAEAGTLPSVTPGSAPPPMREFPHSPFPPFGEGHPRRLVAADAPVLAAPDRPAGPARRDFLFGSGALGAAVLAGGLLGPAGRAATARRTWLAGFDTTPTKADWDALRKKLSTGKLYLPGQTGYNVAKELFSPQWDSLKPSGVAYCRRASDVAACIAFVVKFKMPVRVRSGGHSYGGWSSVNNGLILDISEMNSVSFGTNTVTVGSGLDLIDFYGALAAHGRAVPGGTCPTVGIAGLALGGGVGALGRRFGLTSDNIRSLDVVTADGVTQTCTATNSNKNLYWASQGGGGGNFGVATSFTFTTANLRSLVLFSVSWPWSQAARVIRGWQSWGPEAPDALWSEAFLGGAFGGAPGVGVAGSYIGSVAGARAELDKLFHLVGTSGTSSVRSYSYLDAMLHYAGCSEVRGCDTPPGGNLPRVPFFAKSDIFTRPLNANGISALIRGIERLRSVRGAAGGSGSISLDALGGAINRIKPDATAFVHRNGLFLAQYYTSWRWPGTSQGRTNQREWLDALYNGVHPHASGQAYQNYADPGLRNWQQAYYGANYGRLSQTKQQYDPHQVFTFPQAIRPPATVPCDGPDC